MVRDLMPWEELLSFETFDEYDDEYGPHTQAVVNCFETLDTISWFSQVGASSPELPEARVNTWTAAIGPLMTDRETYDEDGHLIGPAEAIAEARQIEDNEDWYDAAFDAVLAYADFGSYIPGYFEKEEVAFTEKYLHTYLQNLTVEIISDIDCTFFREQLSWYEAGHFCCGWEGDWPDGVLRVF